ncbi:MAG: DUF2846 domain-containing protein [Luteolibacter sp.]
MTLSLRGRFFNLAAICVVFLGMVSCASGPSYSEAVKSLPPIPKGKGRVFVYRPSSMGMALRPDIRIDQKSIGTSTAQGFSYSDQPPGKHDVSLTTEWTRKGSVQVQPGQASFVRTSLGMGLITGHLIPTAVEKSVGEREIQKCKLVTE